MHEEQGEIIIPDVEITIPSSRLRIKQRLGHVTGKSLHKARALPSFAYLTQYEGTISASELADTMAEQFEHQPLLSPDFVQNLGSSAIKQLVKDPSEQRSAETAWVARVQA